MAKGAYCVIGYPEDPAFNLDIVLAAIRSSGAEYAYILHDKDTWDTDGEDRQGNKHKAGDLKKAHYHFMIGWEVGFPKDFKAFKAWCKSIGLVAISKKECLVRNPEKAYDYLIHKDSP